MQACASGSLSLLQWFLEHLRYPLKNINYTPLVAGMILLPCLINIFFFFSFFSARTFHFSFVSHPGFYINNFFIFLLSLAPLVDS